MTDDLNRNARRFIEERRLGFERPKALDAYFERFAERVAARQPRCDLTIGQLPTVPSVLGSDIFPIFRNGNTYSVPVSGSVAATLPATSDLSGFGIYNVMAYGAIGNGSTDDSAAILKAVAAAALHGQGSSVVFPPGYIFPYNQTLNGPIIINWNDGSLRGFNGVSQIQFTGTTGDCIQFNAGFGARLTDLYINCPNATSGYAVNVVKGGPIRFDNFFIYTNWSGIGLTESAGAHNDMQMSNFAVIHTNNTGGAYIGLDIQTANSAIKFTNFLLVANNASTGSTGIRGPVSVNQDTVQFSNFSVNNYAFLMDFSPVGGSAAASDYLFSNFVCDQAGFQGIRFGASGGGVNNRFHFDNGWIQAGSQTNALAINFVSTTLGVGYEFNNCRIEGGVGTSGTGLYVNSTLNGNGTITCNDCIFEGTTGPAVQIAADARVYLNNCQARGCNTGLNVTIGSATVEKRIVNCNFNINTTTPFSGTSPGSLGPLFTIRNCPGITPYGAVGPPGFPLTTVALQNPYCFDIDVYLTGGTVTQVAITPFGKSATNTNQTSGLFHLKVGDSITYTYTGSPSHVWIAR